MTRTHRKGRPVRRAAPAEREVDTPQEPKAPQDPHDLWLIANTGRPAAYWVSRVQTLIQQATDYSRADKPPAPGLSAGHGETDVMKWLTILSEEILALHPTRPVDSNIWLASVLGVILLLWSLRLMHAKACDPVRPLADRQRAARYRMWVCEVLTRVMVDDSQDAQFFAGQRWQSPWDPKATSGSFR